MATKQNLPKLYKEAATRGSAPPSETGVNAGSAVPGTREEQTAISSILKNQGDSAITSISGGRSGSGGGGSRVSYIGNDGAKKTGTVKVTPGTTPDYYTQMGNLYQKAYDDQIAANAAALEEASARAKEATDAQIAELAEQYAGTNRQLYRDYMERRRVLPQQMAAMGYNGGLSESSLLRLNNSYEEGLNENERARLAQQGEYDRALAEMLYAAQAKRSDADSQALQNLYSQQAALKEAEYRDAQQRAATMAAAGDFSEYKRLGFSNSEIEWLKRFFYKNYPQFA